MRILAVDTSADPLSLALGAGERVLRFHRKLRSPHDETLIREVDRLLARAGTRLERLDAVAAACGPGRFTGIRIGMGFAAVAASQLGVPAVAVSHFEAAAFRARAQRLAVVVEGLRGEKYYQLFRRRGGFPKAEGRPVWVRAADWPGISETLRAGGWTLEDCAVSAADLLGPARRALSAGAMRRFEPLYIKPANFETGKNTLRLAR